MTPSRPDEQHLIDAIARGDTDAFDTVYHANRDFVFRVARRFCGDDHLALDVAQEVFAWLHQRCGRGDLRLAGRLSTLLYPLTRNIAVSAMRSWLAQAFESCCRPVVGRDSAGAGRAAKDHVPEAALVVEGADPDAAA